MVNIVMNAFIHVCVYNIVYTCTIYSPAQQLKDFIKHGKTLGWVEIELYNKHGRNWVIRRVLNNMSSSHMWMLNGKEALKKEVSFTESQFVFHLFFPSHVYAYLEY